MKRELGTGNRTDLGNDRGAMRDGRHRRTAREAMMARPRPVRALPIFQDDSSRPSRALGEARPEDDRWRPILAVWEITLRWMRVRTRREAQLLGSRSVLWRHAVLG